MCQLLLIPETAEERMLREIDEIKISMTKQRKKLFAENGSLKKMYLDAIQRLEIIEDGLCKGKL